jgi:hypothetical protein
MADEHPQNWLQRLLGIPVIGEWLGLLVLVAPFLVGGLFARNVLGISTDIDTESGVWYIIMAAVLAIWLVWLEHIARVRLVLPVVKIPMLWLTAVFAVWGLLKLIGLLS